MNGVLFRATGVTHKELEMYKKLVDNTNYSEMMRISGFLSTTKDRQVAEKYAWSNKQSGHLPTLFEFKMYNSTGYCSMEEVSAFPEEREVVLMDGMRFEVVSVGILNSEKQE